MSEWDQAFDPKKIGVIHSQNGKKVLQLWRSTTIVDGYVSIADSKIAELRRLTNIISRALSQPLHRHISALIVDRPGSGKNHLIECLAKMFDIDMAPTINIVDMNSRLDILDCFDSIVISQSRADGKPILVLVDEINARVDGQYVYGSFLRPLEEGYYYRAQKPFKIDPCVWIFAGSDRPNKSENSAGSNFKVSDFENRLTERCFDFRDIVDSERERRLEQVYLGAILLTRLNADVRAISEKVLQSFSLMPNGTVVRDLRHLIERLEYIKYGEVLSSDFIDGALANWLDEESVADWSQSDEGDLVEIEL